MKWQAKQEKRLNRLDERREEQTHRPGADAPECVALIGQIDETLAKAEFALAADWVDPGAVSLLLTRTDELLREHDRVRKALLQ